MRATEKLEILEWASHKLMELARAGDREGVERVYRWAASRVGGSNSRKWALEGAYRAAVEALRS